MRLLPCSPEMTFSTGIIPEEKLHPDVIPSMKAMTSESANSSTHDQIQNVTTDQQLRLLHADGFNLDTTVQRELKEQVWANQYVDFGQLLLMLYKSQVTNIIFAYKMMVKWCCAKSVFR